MFSPIKRRDFFTYAALLTGAAFVPAARADTTTPASVDGSTTPEGIALVSVAYAKAGFQLSPDLSDEVHRRLSGYPDGFAAVRAIKLANELAPSMGLSMPVPIAKPYKAVSNPTPAPVLNNDSTTDLPSEGDVKPLPVPSPTPVP